MILAGEGPAAEEGEVVDGVGAVFLDGHGEAEHDPAGRLVRGDADGLVGVDARQAAHVADVGLSLVLAGWRPFADDLTDGVQAVFVVVGAGEQVEGGAPTILKRLKLAERGILLLGSQPFPLILAAADVQRIIVSDSSW